MNAINPNAPRQKIYFEKVAYFSERKSAHQNTTFLTQFTTNSPRFTITKHHKNLKNPAKSPIRPLQKNILQIPQNSSG
jgi:hypothetical protein